MIDKLVQHIIYDFTPFELYGLNFGYFFLLYFAIGPLFLLACKFLEKKKMLNKIVTNEAPKNQLRFELLHSFKSIVVFGFSIFPVIYLIRIGAVELLPNSFLTVALGILILTLWNEVHFFVVHRIMHLPFFMQKVHIIHHRSRVSSVFSVYSFHWLEALLLSTVPITIIPFIPFAPVAIFLYPLASILLNFSGHCNYRFGNGEGNSWRVFGTHHNAHHFSGKKNYGFALNFFDKLISKPSKKNRIKPK